ncbi:MAG: hypothetical protein LBC53_07640 [Spirochaetaceae bacterium]|nr:hypothetical protein [Spirochaetaceae bacterium]
MNKPAAANYFISVNNLYIAGSAISMTSYSRDFAKNISFLRRYIVQD